MSSGNDGTNENHVNNQNLVLKLLIISLLAFPFWVAGQLVPHCARDEVHPVFTTSSLLLNNLQATFELDCL